MTKPLAVLFVVVASLTSSLAIAHHGFGVHYDISAPVRIEGRVHQANLRNPHSMLKIAVTDRNGDDVVWTCETQAGSILRRKGVTADRFIKGEPIVIEGSQARRDPHGCEVGSIEFADGEKVVLRTPAGHARINVNNIGGSEFRNASVFGMWLRDGFSGPPMTPGFMEKVTEAGRNANAGYDGSRDDPTNHCSPVNPVRAWIAPGTPTDIRERDGHVEIQHEFMDTTRIVNMDGGALPADIEPSDMGYSVGRIVGDSLIIETSHFEAGVMLTHVGESGVLHTEDLLMTEVITVDPDTGELVIKWEAQDAQYFPGAITGQLKLSPTKLSINPFDCVPRDVD